MPSAPASPRRAGGHRNRCMAAHDHDACRHPHGRQAISTPRPCPPTSGPGRRRAWHRRSPWRPRSMIRRGERDTPLALFHLDPDGWRLSCRHDRRQPSGSRWNSASGVSRSPRRIIERGRQGDRRCHARRLPGPEVGGQGRGVEIACRPCGCRQASWSWAAMHRFRCPPARRGLAGALGMAWPAAFRRTLRAGGKFPPDSPNGGHAVPPLSTALTPGQLARDLAVRDLTDPTQGDHAIQLLTDAAVASLTAAWGCQVRWHRGPRVVAVADNYDRLRIPPDAVSRDVRYTRYLDERRMLRSHATAMIPAALRALAAEP